MVATKIIGVDFSGAKDEHKSAKTWVAQGRMDDAGVLRLDSVQPMIRADLHDLLAGVKPPAVAAMDFPFGVPKEFAKYICRPDRPGIMSDVWQKVAKMEDGAFFTARENFMARRRKVPMRVGDNKYYPYPQSYSPLCKAPIKMLPMTYHGIAMLHHLHQAAPQRWHVPPLQPTNAVPEHTVTLLEVMPGAFLNAIGFIAAITRNPGYKISNQAIPNRDIILAGLSENSGVPLPNVATVRNGCRANDDCLDAVVAAVAAAAWARNPDQFRHPNDDELPSARIEGWLYAPNPIIP